MGFAESDPQETRAGLTQSFEFMKGNVRPDGGTPSGSAQNAEKANIRESHREDADIAG
jgi:hypothetical protein